MQNLMKNVGKNLKIIWGINLLLFGAFWMTYILGWLPQEMFGQFWGLFILLPGVASILLHGTMLTNTLLTFGGAIALSLSIASKDKLIIVIPIIVILSGLFILFGNNFKGKSTKK